MEFKERPDIPEEKIVQVNNTKKLNFKKPYKFIYLDWWFHIATLPIYLITYVLVWICHFALGLKVKDRNKVKALMKKRGCITVSNHCHYFDTVFANYIFFPQRVYISVVQRNYEVPFVRTVLRILRAFPIPATPVGFKMITEPIRKTLAAGHHVHFLPEGDLVHLSQTIHRFKLGAFHQSYLQQTPIIPMVYVMKRRRIFGKELPPNWVKMTCFFGDPVYPPQLIDEKTFPRKELREMAESVANWMEETIAREHATPEQKA